MKVGNSNSENQWKILVNIAFEVFDDQHIEELSFHDSCRFLFRIIQLSNVYSSTWQMIERRLPFFEKLLENEKLSQGSTDIKFVVLKMMNLVQDLLKRENRRYLCEFGEKNTHNILQLCEDQNCFQEVVKFFNTQMCLHNPQGGYICIL